MSLRTASVVWLISALGHGCLLQKFRWALVKQMQVVAGEPQARQLIKLTLKVRSWSSFYLKKSNSVLDLKSRIFITFWQKVR